MECLILEISIYISVATFQNMLREKKEKGKEEFTLFPKDFTYVKSQVKLIEVKVSMKNIKLNEFDEISIDLKIE